MVLVKKHFFLKLYFFMLQFYIFLYIFKYVFLFTLLKLPLPDIRYLIATNKAIELVRDISKVTPKCKHDKDVIG